MSTATKTDNASLPEKLAIRRRVLDALGDEQLDVLDCCQGSGVLWANLRREYRVGRYTGLDVKPKPGRLKVDSERVVGRMSPSYNVIDIDTYGSPIWHWLNLLPKLTRRTAVFLTWGRRGGQTGAPKPLIRIIFGRETVHPKAPHTLIDKVVNRLGTPVALSAAFGYNVTYEFGPVRIARATGTEYIGAIIKPAPGGTPEQVDTP